MRGRPQDANENSRLVRGGCFVTKLHYGSLYFRSFPILETGCSKNSDAGSYLYGIYS